SGSVIALSHFCYRRRKTQAPQGPRKLPKLDVAGSTAVARSRRSLRGSWARRSSVLPLQQAALQGIDLVGRRRRQCREILGCARREAALALRPLEQPGDREDRLSCLGYPSRRGWRLLRELEDLLPRRSGALRDVLQQPTGRGFRARHRLDAARDGRKVASG